jgi:hypothetical protein
MIKDKNTDIYFYSIEEFVNFLDIDPEIENECILSLDNCVTEQDYVDFANEYELKLNDGMMIHEYKVI